ncbi:MAG TPA: DUF3857 domain-containing protein [Verrucomicrobiae bacterium]
MTLRLCFAFLAGAAARADSTAPAVHPPSAWVKPLNFKRPIDGADASQDDRWLLSDRQINALNDEEFIHEVRQALTPAGVQYGSRIMVACDPSCQSITFHWVRVWRGAKKLDRLDPSRLRANSNSAAGEEFLFGGRKTSWLQLDDVRVGDIVDYAYTIEGASPAEGGKFSGAAPLQFSQPVERAVTRLVWPATRRLYIKNYLTDLKPSAARRPGSIDYTWSVSNAPALRLEPDTPAWFDPWPRAQLSEWAKWADINRWALGLFRTTNALPAELARKIVEWKKLPRPASRVQEALRFTQEEIRSPDTEAGEAGYEPAQPSVVFARRSGDGKDKALFLVAVLRALKIEASPVLVNTRRGQDLAQLQPSPGLFNHAIVRAAIEGQNFWLDPAQNHERGPLSVRTWPNYGAGLVIASNTTELTAIPPCPIQPRTTVSEYLNVGATLAAESTIKIVTVAEGADADRLRERFATAARNDIERDNLNQYARYYPYIRRLQPLQYSDDEQQNRVQTTEFYGVQNMWSRLPDEANYHARIFSVNVDQALTKPAVTYRTMPLSLRHPVHQLFHAEISIRSGLPLDLAAVRVDDPSFFFQRVINVVNGMLYLNCEYRSLADSVAPEAMPAYARDLDTATAALGYSIVGY